MRERIIRMDRFELSSRGMKEVAFTYVIIIIIIMRCLKISEFVSSLLVLPAFIVIPSLFGEIVIKVFRHLRVFAKSVPFSIPSLFIFSWLLGSHFMAVLFLVSTLLHLQLLVKWLPILITCLITANLVYERTKARSVKKSIRVSATSLFSLILVSLVAVGVISITKEFVLFPRIWGNTYFMLQYNVLYAYRTVEGGFFYGGNWPDWLYSSLIYSLFGVNPLYFMWSAPFIIGIMYALGIYSVTLRMSGDIKLAIISGVFSMLIHFTRWPPSQFMHLKSNIIMFAVFPWILLNTYEILNRNKYEVKNILKILVMLFGIILSIFVSFRLLYQLPWRSPEWSLFIETTIQPIVMAVLPFLGLLLSKIFKRDVYKGLFLLLFIQNVTFCFMHTGEPLLYLLTLSIFTLAYVMAKVNSARASFLISLLIFFSFLYLYLQLNGLKIYSTNLFSPILYPELKLENPIDFSYRNTTLFNLAYPHALPYLLVIGAIFALFSRKKENVLMTFMLAFLLLCLFLPDLMAPRFYHLLAPFSSYTLSFGFISIIKESCKIFKWKRSLRIKHVTCLFLIAIMFLTTFPPLIAHVREQSYLRSLPPPEGYTLTSIVDYEYEAALWIKENLPETTVIVSDYKTIQVLGSIGDTIWLPGRGMGAETLDEESKELLNRIKNDVFKANCSEEAFRTILTLPKLMHVQDKRYIKYAGIKQDNLTFIVVLSSRTVKWLNQQSINDVLEAQYASIPQEYLRIFLDPKYFELIYTDKDGYLYIFKLRKSIDS